MTENLLDHATFICGHRKGGTTMLLCLLDDHPQLLTYPADSSFSYRYYPHCERHDYTDAQRVELMFQYVVEQLEREIKKLAPAEQDRIGFPYAAYYESYRRAIEPLEKTPANQLRALMQAYRTHYPGSQRARRWVEKTTSTEIYAVEFAAWFPSVKFVHIIRDPRDNWGSLKSGWEGRYQHFNDSPERLLQSLIERAGLGLRFARDNAALLGADVYHVVRFEDLTAEPESVLHGIAGFLGVEFSEKMLTPSVCGVPWEGNNFEGKRFRGPSNVNVGRWRERIEPHDAALIEYYLGDIMAHHGYAPSFSADETVAAASKHYKWSNFATPHSFQPQVAPRRDQ